MIDRISTSYYRLPLEPMGDAGHGLLDTEELILVEPTPEWIPSNRADGWEERGLSDGSRYEIYRRYFTADTFAEELGGRILFAGRWMVMATVGR